MTPPSSPGSPAPRKPCSPAPSATSSPPEDSSTSPWLPRSLEIVDGPAYLRSQIRNFADHDVYLCGPGPWMNAVRADLARLDIPRERIHFENFSI